MDWEEDRSGSYKNDRQKHAEITFAYCLSTGAKNSEVGGEQVGGGAEKTFQTFAYFQCPADQEAPTEGEATVRGNLSKGGGDCAYSAVKLGWGAEVIRWTTNQGPGWGGQERGFLITGPPTTTDGRKGGQTSGLGAHTALNVCLLRGKGFDSLTQQEVERDHSLHTSQKYNIKLVKKRKKKKQ